MVFYKILVEKCLDKRNELKLSSEELVERTGLDLETIQLFESGSEKISVEAFLKIIDNLKIELSAHSL